MKIFPFLLKSFLFWGNYCRPISIVDIARPTIYETVVHGAQEESDGQERYRQTRRTEKQSYAAGPSHPRIDKSPPRWHLRVHVSLSRSPAGRSSGGSNTPDHVECF